MAELRIRGRSYSVEQHWSLYQGTRYVLKGARGAIYGTLRVVAEPERMWLCDSRAKVAAVMRGVFLTDRNGKLEVLAQ